MCRKGTRLRTAFISHRLQNSSYRYKYMCAHIYNVSGNSQGDLANMAPHHSTRHFTERAAVKLCGTGWDQGSQAEKHFLGLTRLPITLLKGHPWLSKHGTCHSQLLHRQRKLRPASPAHCSPHSDGEKPAQKVRREQGVIFKKEIFSSEGGEAVVQVFQRGGGCLIPGNIQYQAGSKQRDQVEDFPAHDRQVGLNGL